MRFKSTLDAPFLVDMTAGKVPPGFDAELKRGACLATDSDQVSVSIRPTRGVLEDVRFVASEIGTRAADDTGDLPLGYDLHCENGGMSVTVNTPVLNGTMNLLPCDFNFLGAVPNEPLNFTVPGPGLGMVNMTVHVEEIDTLTIHASLAPNAATVEYELGNESNRVLQLDADFERGVESCMAIKGREINRAIVDSAYLPSALTIDVDQAGGLVQGSGNVTGWVHADVLLDNAYAGEPDFDLERFDFKLLTPVNEVKLLLRNEGTIAVYAPDHDYVVVEDQPPATGTEGGKLLLQMGASGVKYGEIWVQDQGELIGSVKADVAEKPLALKYVDGTYEASVEVSSIPSKAEVEFEAGSQQSRIIGNIPTPISYAKLAFRGTISICENEWSARNFLNLGGIPGGEDDQFIIVEGGCSTNDVKMFFAGKLGSIEFGGFLGSTADNYWALRATGVGLWLQSDGDGDIRYEGHPILFFIKGEADTLNWRRRVEDHGHGFGVGGIFDVIALQLLASTVQLTTGPAWVKGIAIGKIAVDGFVESYNLDTNSWKRYGVCNVTKSCGEA